MNEILKEEIKIETEIARVLALLILTDISGVISLILQHINSPACFVFILFGTFTTIIMSVLVVMRVDKIYSLIKKLNST